VLQKNNY